MRIENMFFDEVILLSNDLHIDNRGYFTETFNLKKFKQGTQIDINFFQDNESMSGKNVARGLHYQESPHCQRKLVRVSYGKIRDFVVDIRKGSKTFGKYESIQLCSNVKNQLFIPEGFAHGFITLLDKTIVNYKVDSYYQPLYAKTISLFDPDIGIDLGIDKKDIILSQQDKNAPMLKDVIK
jgi:dTDP-4-dehydrorhamnose 3,5-epimerase